MDPVLIQLLAFGLLAGAANMLGGLILFPSSSHNGYRRNLKYLLALGAGFMLAVTFFEILPKTFWLWRAAGENGAEGYFTPMVLLLGGYLLTQFFEHTIAPHFHLGEEVHSSHDLLPKGSAYAAVGGLLIHTFFDGISIAAASMIDVRVGFLVFVAVFLHKFPEGFTVGSMMLAAGKGRRGVLVTTGVIGLTTFAGVVLYYLVGPAIGFTLAYALPVACGVTLYVAASDLIPEVNHHGGQRPLVSLSVFAGVAIFFAVHFTLQAVGGE
ncbi:MAG: ZIP family metal transporter [Pyrinomonadaceae bacterium]